MFAHRQHIHVFSVRSLCPSLRIFTAAQSSTMHFSSTHTLVCDRNRPGIRNMSIDFCIYIYFFSVDVSSSTTAAVFLVKLRLLLLLLIIIMIMFSSPLQHGVLSCLSLDCHAALVCRHGRTAPPAGDCVLDTEVQ